MDVPDMSDITDLPEPDSAARDHSRWVVDAVVAAIRDNSGVISFADYMDLVLHAPGLGYYCTGSRKFGQEGDFITAPELSPWYSRCIARQCRQVLEVLDSPAIIEAGPGSGIMACDILLELERLNLLPDRYVMLETSAELRERQQQLAREKIPHLAETMQWWDSLPDVPLEGIVLANEVLDAMPVHRVRYNNGCFTELGVTEKDGKLDWMPFPLADQGLLNEIERRMGELVAVLPENYETEFNLYSDAWLRSMAGVINRGAMLLIDYGYTRSEYYHPQRLIGTLLCHYRHRVHADPFYYPGLQDITASVDFTTIAETAVDAGLKVAGFTTQAHFLMACGLLEMIRSDDPLSETEQAKRSQQVKILTMPAEMGERCKVMALARDLDIDWLGFGMTDFRSRL